MVEEEKLLEWVREKLEQGVDEQRIRKSLKETGHDPALLEKAKDPFHGSGEGAPDGDPVREDQKEDSGSEEVGQEHDRGISQTERNTEKDQKDQKKTESRDNRRNRNERTQENPRNQQRPESQKRNQEGGREPSIDLSNGSSGRNQGGKEQKPNNSHGTRDNQPDLGRDGSQNQSPQKNMEGQQRNQQQFKNRQKKGESKDKGHSLPSFSLPSISLPSFSLNLGKPSVPRKYVAGLLILLLVCGAGFGIYSSGLLENAEAPSLPIDDSSESTDSSTQEASNTQTQSNEGCPDVGVRIQNVYRTDSGITADLKLFGSEILAVAELVEGGSVVESREITISDTKRVNFDSEGSKVVFRPYDCNKIKDSYEVS